MINIRIKLLTLLFCGFISAQHVVGSGLEYVKIETESTGVSVKEAIDSALVQAIERVNGKSMESSSFLKTIEISEQKIMIQIIFLHKNIKMRFNLSRKVK